MAVIPGLTRNPATLKATSLDTGFRRFWDNEVLLDMQGVLNKLFLKVTPPNLPFAKGEG
jgi:hypothetical protein